MGYWEVKLKMKFLFQLKLLMYRAMRKRVWYRLSRLDRALICLSSKLKAVISQVLRRQLSQIVMRLQELLHPITALTESLGKKLVKQIVTVALSWGYKSAETWLKDRKFMQYLTIMELNT